MLNGTVPAWPLRSRASQESLKKKTLRSRDRRCVAAADCCLVSREVKKASKATSWGSQGQAGNCALYGKEQLLLEPLQHLEAGELRPPGGGQPRVTRHRLLEARQGILRRVKGKQLNHSRSLFMVT